jgi:hypothetical protein
MIICGELEYVYTPEWIPRSATSAWLPSWLICQMAAYSFTSMGRAVLTHMHVVALSYTFVALYGISLCSFTTWHYEHIWEGGLPLLLAGICFPVVHGHADIHHRKARIFNLHLPSNPCDMVAGVSFAARSHAARVHAPTRARPILPRKPAGLTLTLTLMLRRDYLYDISLIYP